MEENGEELQSLLMKLKEESEKAGLELSVQKTKIMASGPITSWEKDGETVADFYFYYYYYFFFFFCSKICRRLMQPWNKKTLTPWKESYDQPRQHIEKQGHNFVNKGLSSQSYGFSCGHVWMWARIKRLTGPDQAAEMCW